MRRKKFAILAVALAIAALAALWLRPRAPFAFLEGKPFFGKPHVVPDNLGGGPPAYEADYAFKGDWTTYLSEVDGNLRSQGWKREDLTGQFGLVSYTQDEKEVKDTVLMYSKDGRSITFYRNAQPTTKPVSDIVVSGQHIKGLIGVSYFENEYHPPALERMRTWVTSFFGTKPKEEQPTFIFDR